MKTPIKNQNGGAAVEFALILPLFIFLLFGIIEFGLLLYNEQVLTNASREGARAGVVAAVPRLSDADIQTVINRYADNYLVTFGTKNFPPATITFNGSSTWPANQRTGQVFQKPLKVEITYRYNFLVLSAFGFGPIDLASQATMKME